LSRALSLDFVIPAKGFVKELEALPNWSTKRGMPAFAGRTDLRDIVDLPPFFRHPNESWEPAFSCKLVVASRRPIPSQPLSPG
jgi:hypothetical protein